MATWDAFALATAIAERTESIELCVGPLATAVRDPMAMAMGVASVAAVARRPVHLAIGSSSQMVVERWHGRARERTARHIRETAEALRPLLAGEKARLRRRAGAHRRLPAAAACAGHLADGRRVRRGDGPGRRARGGPDGAEPRDSGAGRTDGATAARRDRRPAAAGGVGRWRRWTRRRRRMRSSRGAWFPTSAAEGYSDMFTAAGFGDIVEAARGGVHPAQLLEQVPPELAASGGTGRYGGRGAAPGRVSTSTPVSTTWCSCPRPPATTPAHAHSSALGDGLALTRR